MQGWGSRVRSGVRSRAGSAVTGCSWALAQIATLLVCPSEDRRAQELGRDIPERQGCFNTHYNLQGSQQGMLGPFQGSSLESSKK